MKSIVYIKKSENDYEILIDYFLRRSIYFQKQLSKLGITRAGYLINFGGEFQYTHFDKHTNDQDTILILDNTIPVSDVYKRQPLIRFLLEKFEILDLFGDYL